MAKLDDILQKAIADIEGVFGCAVIDSDNRKLICVANKISALSPNYIEALAVAVVELVRGKQVQAIETLLSGKLNTPVANAIDEMCINAGKTRHFIAVFPGKANRLIVLSTDQNTSVAMGWIIMYRTIVPLISRGIFSQSPDA
jgi:hypothetical protein